MPILIYETSISRRLLFVSFDSTQDGEGGVGSVRNASVGRERLRLLWWTWTKLLGLCNSSERKHKSREWSGWTGNSNSRGEANAWDGSTIALADSIGSLKCPYFRLVRVGLSRNSKGKTRETCLVRTITFRWFQLVRTCALKRINEWKW